MDDDKLSVVVVEFVVGGWIILRLEGWLFVVEKIHKEEEQIG
jgi:hypothetical protein